MTGHTPTSREILERLAAELTSRQLDAYLLREVSGYTFTQIADQLGCTRQTAHDHHRRAVNRVAQLLRDGAWPA